MKHGIALSRLLLLAVLPALVLVSCQNATGPGTPGTDGLGGSQYKGNLYGKVTTTNNTPVSGVEVRVGTLATTTNSKGEFLLIDVPAETRLLVNFSHGTYTATQKIVRVPRGRMGFVEASVIPIGTTQSVGVTGGLVQFNGARVDFPANAFVDAQGTAFTGQATVRATWFDPTSSLFTRTFPGDFEGVRTDGSSTAIESYGFMRVDISANGQKLQLAAGRQATLTFPVPVAIRSRAPQTIPLWYYDEAKGQWIEEGSATLVGANYVGTVSHFSSWNCDQPQQTSYLRGRVVDKNGAPLGYAHVNTQGVDYTGASRTQTDLDGYFTVPVKSSAVAKVWANYFIVSGPSQNVNTPATGQTLDIGTLTIPADTTDFCIITGRLVDNAGNPLSGMYVVLKDATNKQVDYVNSSKDGVFRFFGEAGASYTIVVNYQLDSAQAALTLPVTCPAVPGTVNLGDLKLDIGGALITGRVVDANGTPLANVMVFAKGANGTSGGQNREAPTDATGRFSLNVRPSTTIDISFYYNQTQKIVSATSGLLGSTTDIGDVVLP